MTKKNETVALAALYHAHILGRPMEFDTTRAKQILGNCKTALNTASEFGGGIDEVSGLMLGLHTGNAIYVGAKYTEYTPWNEWAPKRKLQVPLPLWVLWKMNVPGRSDLLLIQDVCQVPEMPNWVDTDGISEWMIHYGKRAFDSGKWNGVFYYPPFRDPTSNPITPEKLRELVGLVKVDESINLLHSLEKELSPCH
jgi:hypothetical protein